MRNNKISIHVCTRDRPTELALLIESLRIQTIQNWDLLIIDDGKNQLVQTSGFLQKLITRVMFEKHKVKIYRLPTSLGVCHARNTAIEQDKFNNMYTCRLDDDSILEPDCLEKLYIGLTEYDYDLVGGTIPVMMMPDMKKNIKTIKSKIINEHKLDSDGKLISNNDECGFMYSENKYIPTHQFRTYCMYISEMNKKVKYPTFLTNVGFREEGFFSTKAILEGYKLAICTGAKAFHLITEIGGCRDPEYSKKITSDNELFQQWLKNKYTERGVDFYAEYSNRW